jgi:hypothetical protein
MFGLSSDARGSSIPQRQVGLGVRKARINLLVVVRVPALESQMSVISQAARVPGVPFIGHISPVSIVELHPRLHRLLYHLLYLIRPEWRVSARRTWVMVLQYIISTPSRYEHFVGGGSNRTC